MLDLPCASVPVSLKWYLNQHATLRDDTLSRALLYEAKPCPSGVELL